MIRMRDITVRMRDESDGPDFFAIAPESWQNSALRWEDLGDNWLVAEAKGHIVGFIQFLLGRPVGRVEHLILDAQRLNDRESHAVMLALSQAACVALRATGSLGASAFVAHDRPGLKRLWKKHFKGRVARTGCIMVTEFTHGN